MVYQLILLMEHWRTFWKFRSTKNSANYEWSNNEAKTYSNNKLQL